MSRRHPLPRQRRRPLKRLATALVILALLAPPAALAQSGGSGAGAARQSSGPEQVGDQSASASSKAGTVGGLPFTALDLAVLAATAAALLGVGLALGRLAHLTRRSSS